MTDNAIVIAVAKLDGWTQIERNHPSDNDLYSGVKPDYPNYPNPAKYELPDYLTSRDAIISVIEKQTDTVQYNTFLQLSVVAYKAIVQSPRALSIALVKAAGNWEE